MRLSEVDELHTCIHVPLFRLSPSLGPRPASLKPKSLVQVQRSKATGLASAAFGPVPRVLREQPPAKFGWFAQGKASRGHAQRQRQRKAGGRDEEGARWAGEMTNCHYKACCVAAQTNAKTGRSDSGGEPANLA
eukprot:CAMPEP_0202055714 /NCGR_PEP_ID=MMETSP0963-20130614/19979_1 /ASSEMBLY_ACC=CAM_ASM_000494 /TAXON_ID=4773 /ORGANISM="Schizochytrium aggregatum, Strain ATCC28209" /LENGTH=133 /DNA_ID=CAMNT_0048621353 /DNA_START=87 /DNA_END=484 /DNA_ORIENTATION=+